jgi:tripartite-type tricarboxylate transporter receptor subunit TctC
MSDRRTPVLQDVPTMQEAGLSGLELDTWIGLFAPAGTPREIVARLNAAVNKALAGDLRDKFAEVGLSAAGGTPEQFAATIREETATYAKLVKASGMPIQ